MSESPPPAAEGIPATDDTPRAGVEMPTPRQVLGLMLTVVLGYGILQIVRSLRSILVMLLVSLFISFAMEPAVQYLGRRWQWRRGLATGVVFLLAIIGAIGMFVSVLPLLIDQVGALLRSVPNTAAELNDLLASVPLLNLQIDPEADLSQELLTLGRRLTAEGGGALPGLSGGLLGAAGSVASIGATAVGLVFQGLTVLLVSFYMVADGPRLRAALARTLPPHRQREMLAVWEIAVAKTGGYIYSRFLLAGVAATVSATFLAILQVPYALPLGLWVGVTGAFVPVIGTYLGGVLPILVALSDRPISAVWVLGFIAVYQQVENYLIAPRLQSATMDIHPAVAFVSVLVGATLLGAVGALLALPATAVLQAVVSTYVHRHELIADLMEASTHLDRQIPTVLPPLHYPTPP